MELSLIIPAYNEELRIEKTVMSYVSNLRKDFKTFEILVVLNGCRDNSLEVMKKMQKEYPKYVRYKNYEEAIGKGGAIIKGLKHSKGDFIGFVDADDAFNVKEIIKLIKLLKVHDCVVASKWKGKSFFQVTEPVTRKFFSRGWNMLTRVMLGLRFEDTQAGAKFLRRKVVDKIGSEFICTNFAFDAELLFKIKENGFKVKEVYIPSKHMEGSTFQLKHSFNMFSDLVKVWRTKD